MIEINNIRSTLRDEKLTQVDCWHKLGFSTDSLCVSTLLIELN